MVWDCFGFLGFFLRESENLKGSILRVFIRGFNGEGLKMVKGKG